MTIETIVVLAIIFSIGITTWVVIRNRKDPEIKPFEESHFVEVNPDPFMSDDEMQALLSEHTAEILDLKPGEWISGDSDGNFAVHKREDLPLAQVFQINTPVDTQVTTPTRENFYMSITEQYGRDWKHPFIPNMHPQQWVRIVAKDYEEARKVAVHYSGGYYAVIQNQRQFNDIKNVYFVRGEYEVLDAATYFDFQKNEAL